MPDFIPFSGSYKPEDVHFLLNPVEIEMTPVDIKEQFIQSGRKHYSEMLSQEPAPDPQHLDIFHRALETGMRRLAKEVYQLACALAQQAGNNPIVLVSLVRAGVPLGVMLQQTLRDMGKLSYHYGISIIRDRGIDTAALAWIEARHGCQNTVFVDGWTGKGAISSELAHSLRLRAGYPDEPRLVVLADPCGRAWLSASVDDWLIPFGIMGAPVSGLISRTLWSSEGFHGCMLCHHLSAFECSQTLVDTVANVRKTLPAPEALETNQESKAALRKISEYVIQQLAQKYGIDNPNYIKPGIAEATRAVLRRVPKHVLVRRYDDPDVTLLIKLAGDKNITVTEVGDDIGPWRAVTIIKKVR